MFDYHLLESNADKYILPIFSQLNADQWDRYEEIDSGLQRRCTSTPFIYALSGVEELRAIKTVSTTVGISVQWLV